MAKDLPYFQFEPSQYMAGSIQFCSLKAQGLFINILSIYWQRECELTTTQVKKRWDEPELIQELLDENIIKLNGDKITIQFLDNQHNNVVELSKTRSENGKRGNKKRWGEDRKPIAKASQSDRKPIAKASQSDRKPIASRVEYSIVDNSIVDDTRINTTEAISDNEQKPISNKKKFTPPSIEAVKKYFIENGYSAESAVKAFDYYQAANWRDSQGKPVLSWKQKCIGNWFKPEHKTQPQQKRGFVA